MDSSLFAIKMPSQHVWLESALRRLKELEGLGPGWDGASARPVNPALIQSAWSFISSDLVSALEAKPDVVPTFQGGLLIEWHTTAVDLIIESIPSGQPSFYLCDNETGDEIEAALGEHMDSLASAFEKLGRRS